MRQRLFIISMLAISIWPTTVSSRNTLQHFSIEEAMNTAAALEKLDKNISFYFGDQAHPEVSQGFGIATTNKKTNSFNKSDLEACQWVFLSAILSLQDRAIRSGANAVVNISSYYQQKVFTSNTEYECGAGAMVAGVALKGKIVSLKK